jgi:hypothetical protein
LDTSAKKKGEIYDTVAERYLKVRDAASNFMISQYGIATFHWNEKESK